nr:MAG TPA: hypothetical protein [Caudoviricetes sp.]
MIWLGLKWAYRALLAGLHKLCDMMLTDTFYLTADDVHLWIETNPETVSLDAYNVQKSPLAIRFWSGEGSLKTAMPAYLTLKVESVAGSSVTILYTYNSSGAVSSYSYTIPADKYPTANRISIYAYEDSARTKEIACRQVNIIVDNATPFPRAEGWSAGLTYKNGEYIMVDDVLYMWSSRVPGNTATDPKTWIQNNPTSKLWVSYPYNKILATQILLANFALIGSAVFKDEYMYSQQGVDASGKSTVDYRGFGKSDFTPNLLLDFLTGSFTCNDVNVRGSIVTPYIGIDVTPNIAKYITVSGRTNAYVNCLGSGYQQHDLYIPSAQDVAAGTELNLYHFKAFGRISPAPYIRITGGEEFLPINKAMITLTNDAELQMKVILYNGANRWLILNSPYNQLKKSPLVLAQGKVYGTNTGASMNERYTFDDSALTVTRQSTGIYRVNFSSSWGLFGTDYIVLLTGYDAVYNTSTNASKATLKSRGTTYFDVMVSDDDSLNDGSFIFQLLELRM